MVRKVYARCTQQNRLYFFGWQKRGWQLGWQKKDSAKIYSAAMSAAKWWLTVCWLTVRLTAKWGRQTSRWQGRWQKNQGVNKDGVNSGVNTKTGCGQRLRKTLLRTELRSKTALFLVRKTELRTVLRSKNRLFSTQGNGTQRSTQRKHENGQGGMITLGNHWMRPRPSHFFISTK